MSWTSRPSWTSKPGPFDQKVARVVRAIPRGHVLSYSQVAARAGKPGGARAVVRALHKLRGIPWWRVIRADGTLAAEVASKQSAKLIRESVRIRGGRGRRYSVAAHTR